MPDFPIKLTGRHAGPDTIRALMQGRIQWPFKVELWYRQRITLADFTPAASTNQTIALNTLFPNNVFPADVDLQAGCLVRNIALPTGTPTALTVTVGGTFDTGLDTDGLLTSSNLLGGGAAAGDILNTPAAANYAARPESGFAPSVSFVATGGNMNTLTSLDLEVLIPWTPRTQISA